MSTDYGDVRLIFAECLITVIGQKAVIIGGL